MWTLRPKKKRPAPGTGAEGAGRSHQWSSPEATMIANMLAGFQMNGINL